MARVGRGGRYRYDRQDNQPAGASAVGSKGKMPQVLLVHGYQISSEDGGRPHLATRDVCRRVAGLIGHRWDFVMLLGGWYHQRNPEVSIADVMGRQLILLGVSEQLLVSRESLGVTHYQPPRDTAEEVLLAGVLLRHLYPQASLTDELSLHVCCLSDAVGRVRHLYAKQGAQVTVYGTWSWFIMGLIRPATQLAVHVLGKWCPAWEERFMAKIRAGRTLSDKAFKPLPNTWPSPVI